MELTGDKVDTPTETDKSQLKLTNTAKTPIGKRALNFRASNFVRLMKLGRQELLIELLKQSTKHEVPSSFYFFSANSAVLGAMAVLVFLDEC